MDVGALPPLPPLPPFYSTSTRGEGRRRSERATPGRDGPGRPRSRVRTGAGGSPDRARRAPSFEARRRKVPGRGRRTPPLPVGGTGEPQKSPAPDATPKITDRVNGPSGPARPPARAPKSRARRRRLTRHDSSVVRVLKWGTYARARRAHRAKRGAIARTNVLPVFNFGLLRERERDKLPRPRRAAKSLECSSSVPPRARVGIEQYNVRLGRPRYK